MVIYGTNILLYCLLFFRLPERESRGKMSHLPDIEVEGSVGVIDASKTTIHGGSNISIGHNVNIKDGRVEKPGT